MPKRLFIALALAAAACPASPALAAPQPTAAQVDQQLQAFGAWVEQIAKAFAGGNAALVQLAPQVNAIVEESRDPASARKAAERMSKVLKDARAAILETNRLLAEVPAFKFSISPTAPVNPDRFLAESRAQGAAMLAYLHDGEALMNAVQRGDRAAAAKAASKLSRSSLLLLDGQVLMYRGRQALFPKTQSAHQTVGIAVQLYRAMGAAARAWFETRSPGNPEPVAAEQRAEFLALAQELEADLRKGRNNLAAERRLVASHRRLALQEAGAQRLIARIDRILGQTERQLGFGDDLVAWLRLRADTQGAALAAQRLPELLSELSGMEQKMIALGADAAAVLADGD